MTREEALEILKIYKSESEENYYVKRARALDMAIQALEQLTSYEQTINKLTKAISEQEPCEDAISRKEVLNQIFYSTDNSGDVVLGSVLRRRIENLPSVRPQEPKSGHWKAVPFNSKHGEYRPKMYECSECGWKIDLCRGLQQDTGHRLFCEHCGARMEGDT